MRIRFSHAACDMLDENLLPLSWVGLSLFFDILVRCQHTPLSIPIYIIKLFLFNIYNNEKLEYEIY